MAETVGRKHRYRKYWIGGLIVVVIGGFIVAEYVGPYTRLVRGVKEGGRIAELQAWGKRVLDHPPEGPGKRVTVEGKDLPEFVGRMPLITVSYVKPQPEQGVAEHVQILCGNRFYHYGLEVGREGYKPLENGGYAYEELEDGVWGFSPATNEKGGGE